MSALKVLHVDDEPDIRELVEISLGLDPELTVKSCSSGADALAAAAAWAPYLILIDVMMPVMDGPQTLGHLREYEATAKIPVVFMTARAQARELAHFLSLGAAGVIPKPFDPMMLAGMVKQYVQTGAPDPALLKLRYVARAKGGVGKIIEIRGKLETDAGANYTRLEEICLPLVDGAETCGFVAVGSAASTLERMVEDAKNGIGSVRDVEHAIDRLIDAIDRDCRDDVVAMPEVRSA